MKRENNCNADSFLSGIYFLTSKGKIVYVGQSDSIITRIGDHIRDNKKIFDNFKFISSKTFFWLDSIKHREYAEAKCIRKFRPKYNKNKHNYYAPFYSFKPSIIIENYSLHGCLMGEFRCFGIKGVADELSISMEEAEPILDAREDELEEKNREWEETRHPPSCLPEIIKTHYGFKLKRNDMVNYK